MQPFFMKMASRWHSLALCCVVAALSLPETARPLAADGVNTAKQVAARSTARIRATHEIAEAEQFKLWLTSVVAAQPGVRNFQEAESGQESSALTKARNAFDTIVFAPQTQGTNDTCSRFESILGAKIESVDRTCHLRPVQIRKLQLAGRGDIKRFFDRAEEQWKEFPQIFETQVVSKELAEQICALHATVVQGPFEGESLFAKTLRKMLTPEQLAEYGRPQSNMSAPGR